MTSWPREENPYLLGKYAPVEREITEDKLPVIGEIPHDLCGLVVRNGPNPRFEAEGRAHWFDGDGMFHAVWFKNGNATYRNRYVRTEAFNRETLAGRSLWRGLRESTRHNPADMPLKDTANTDVVFFNKHLIGLWYVSGQPYKLDPWTLETLGTEDFFGERSCNLSAHSKVDEHTGELMFFDYGPKLPYMTYGVASPDGHVKHFVPIDLPGPRLPHDMMMTQHFSILMDLPLTADVEAAKHGYWVTKFDRNTPSRFGVIPRHGSSDSIRWFEASPCYIYHSVNAWEQGDEIVMLACRIADPVPPYQEGMSRLEHAMLVLRLRSQLYRWRLNLKTGAVHEEQVDDQYTEFPIINRLHLGRRSRYSYNVFFSPEKSVSFESLIQYDTDTGSCKTHRFGSGRYGNEAAFAPRAECKAEDDGYLLTFVHDEREDVSELWIIDAQNVERPPVGRVRLPQRVPMGFHACWVSADRLGADPG